jgi:hypothetical protein
MKKLLNNPWFVGVLALAAVVFVARSLIPARAGVSASVSADSGEVAPSEQVTPAVSGSGGIQEALKEVLLTPNARDPFSPRAKAAAIAQAVVEKAPPPDIVETIRLTALWTQDGTTYALINDRIHCVGDRVGSLTVDTATQDGVWVTHWKGRDFLTLGGSFTLTTPALKAAALTLSTES